MSMLDPRSNRCVIAELCEKYPICTNYANDLYYGFRYACLHPNSEEGQTKCPLGLVKDGHKMGIKMSKKDPTVKELIATMSFEERKAIYDIISCLRSKSGNYSAAIIIKNMPEEKQMVAYWLIGNVVLAKEKVDKAIAEIKELLKL